MKLLIIGADGQLGYDYVKFCKIKNIPIIAFTINDLNITIRNDVFKVLEKYEFDVIINTTAYHGYQAYKDNLPGKYYDTNVFGPYYLAEYAREKGKALMHFSTDYVFSGSELPRESGFIESDIPFPANLYASSKLAGEQIIPTILDRHFIFRIASIYGHNGCLAKNKSNFVEMVITKLNNNDFLDIVDDIYMSPTSTKSIVQKSHEVIKSKKYGLYHLAGSGSCSWFDFALEIAKYLGLRSDLIRKTNSENYEQEIKRGNYTSLVNKKLIDNGFSDLKSWKENLYEYLNERKKIIGEK